MLLKTYFHSYVNKEREIIMFTRKYDGVNYETTKDGAFILTDEDVLKLKREMSGDKVNSWKQFALDTGAVTYIRYSDSLSFNKRFNLAIGEEKPNNKQESSFFQEFWNDTPKHQIKKKMEMFKTDDKWICEWFQDYCIELQIEASYNLIIQTPTTKYVILCSEDEQDKLRQEKILENIKKLQEKHSKN